MIIKRVLTFVVAALMGVSCMHFGGVELYTPLYGIGLLFTFLVSAFLALLPKSSLKEL